jgi:Amino acid synthesis
MIEIRRIFTQVETIHQKFGPAPERPLLRGAIAAVLTSPFAGRYDADLLPMTDALGAVGIDMTQGSPAAMNVPASAMEGYGKCAIAGAAGELEHGAMWHVPGGYAMRELLGWKGNRNTYIKGNVGGNGPAISAEAARTANALSIVPIGHKDAAFVRSHFDAMQALMSDAPRANEIVVAVVVADNASLLTRVGGLLAKDIVGLDGLR